MEGSESSVQDKHSQGVSFGAAVEEVSPSGAVTSSAVQFQGEEETREHQDDMPVSSRQARMSLVDRFSMIKREHYFYRRSVKSACYPHGFLTKNFVPVLITLLAWILTVFSSWNCRFFKGAEIGFTSNSYGLWTVKDMDGSCQAWEVLFYSYLLDPSLVAARSLSMISMVLGLSLVVSIVQANQYHILSWGLGFLLMLLFIISAGTTSQFNLWTIFYAFTYIIFTLIVRCLLIHPIHRKISKRGTKIICFFFVLCGVCCCFSFLALNSVYCTCDGLSKGELDGRVITDCEGTCDLDIGGYLMIVAILLWAGAAVSVMIIGAQPEVLDRDPTKRESMYGKYANTKSITSQAIDIAGIVKSTLSKTESKELEKSLSDIPEVDAETGDDSGADQNDGESEHKLEDDSPDSDSREKDSKDSMDEKYRPDQEGDHSRRTWTQKICCDYQITPRSRRGKICFWAFRCALGFIFVFYIFILVIFIGSREERIAAEKAPDTTPNFILDPVCAFNTSEPEADFITFPNAESALAGGLDIAHCELKFPDVLFRIILTVRDSS